MVARTRLVLDSWRVPHAGPARHAGAVAGAIVGAEIKIVGVVDVDESHATGSERCHGSVHVDVIHRVAQYVTDTGGYHVRRHLLDNWSGFGAAIGRTVVAVVSQIDSARR